MKAVIDVREWQTIIDMKSGYPCPFDGPQAEQMRRIAAALPYPGDRGLAGIEWVFRGAKAALAFNDPQWLCLDFTQPYFSGLHRPEQPGERAADRRGWRPRRAGGPAARETRQRERKISRPGGCRPGQTERLKE